MRKVVKFPEKRFNLMAITWTLALIFFYAFTLTKNLIFFYLGLVFDSISGIVLLTLIPTIIKLNYRILFKRELFILDLKQSLVLATLVSITQSISKLLLYTLLKP